MRRTAGFGRRATLAIACTTAVAVVAGCSASGAAVDHTTTTPTASSASTSPDSGSTTSPSPGATSSASTGGTTTSHPGTIHQTVPARTIRTLPAVAAGASAHFGTGVAVAASFRSITAKAQGPGEVGGPGVAVTLTFTNSGASAVNLSDAVVTMSDSHGDPAGADTGAPASAAGGRLLPGHSVRGVYVFTVARDRRDPLTVIVSYTANEPYARIVEKVA